MLKFVLEHTFDPSESKMGESSPMPGAVVKRRTLANCTMSCGDSIHAVCCAMRGNEIAIQRPAQVPGVILEC